MNTSHKLALILAIVCLARPVQAQSPEDDDVHTRPRPWSHGLGEPILRGPVSGLPPPPRVSSRSNLSLKLGGAQRANGRADFGASLVLQVPLSGWVRKAKGDGAVAHGASEPAPEAPEPLTDEVPRIRPDDVRAAVRAAFSGGALEQETERLDDLVSRARWSAALPELRLRATRLVDESTALSPTSYDPGRTTASEGASLWLEARATWSLDRLLFVHEEVGIERLRRQLDEQRQQRVREVVALLFRWQAATVDLLDVTLSPPACLQAWVKEQQLAAELDLATRGWFSRWRANKLGAEPARRCAVSLDEAEYVPTVELSRAPPAQKERASAP